MAPGKEDEVYGFERLDDSEGWVGIVTGPPGAGSEIHGDEESEKETEENECQ